MRSLQYNLSWDYQNYYPFHRQGDILLVTLQFSFFIFIDFIRQNKSSIQYQKRAKWLVKKIIKLGPTFIKIGQALSTRPDLIPLEYIEEFSKLQDRVPPFLSKDAISIIEEELGEKIDNIYHKFEPEPIAAASLGQVHLAILNTGEKVVIKVQRQGLENYLS